MYLILLHKQQQELCSVNSVYCKLDKHDPDSSISKIRNLVSYITIILKEVLFIIYLFHMRVTPLSRENTAPSCIAVALKPPFRRL